MSDDGKWGSKASLDDETLEHVSKALKTWVAPKVIVSTISETEIGSNGGTDGGGGGAGGQAC